MHRDQARVSAHLRPFPNAAQMVGVANAHQHKTVGLRLFDGQCHGLASDHLAVAAIAVDDQCWSVVLDHGDLLVGQDQPVERPVDIARHDADTMRVVTHQGGFNQGRGDGFGFSFIGTQPRENVLMNSLRALGSMKTSGWFMGAPVGKFRRLRLR